MPHERSLRASTFSRSITAVFHRMHICNVHATFKHLIAAERARTCGSRPGELLGIISCTFDATLTEENSCPGSRNRQPPGYYVRSTPRGRSELNLTSANAKRMRPVQPSAKENSRQVPGLSPRTAQSRPSVVVGFFPFLSLSLYSSCTPFGVLRSIAMEKGMPALWRMVMSMTASF